MLWETTSSNSAALKLGLIGVRDKTKSLEDLQFNKPKVNEEMMVIGKETCTL